MEEDRYSLKEIPTQVTRVLIDKENEQEYSGDEIMLLILNKLNKIESLLK